MAKGSERSATSRGERSRTSILNAAISLFARHGYRGAALSAVADAADLTQPGLLHHFPSKADLLTAVLAERDEADLQRLREAWGTSGHALLEGLRSLVAHNATRRDLVALFTVLVGEGVSPEHPAHDYFVDRYHRVREGTRARLAESQAAGEFRSDVDAQVVASLLLSVMDGLQVQWLLDERTDMTATFGVFVDMLAAYLSPEPTAPHGPGQTSDDDA